MYESISQKNPEESTQENSLSEVYSGDVGRIPLPAILPEITREKRPSKLSIIVQHGSRDNDGKGILDQIEEADKPGIGGRTFSIVLSEDWVRPEDKTIQQLLDENNSDSRKES